MRYNEITTIPALRLAIKSCAMVLMTPRFGVCDREFKVAKKEALWLIESYKDDLTPRQMEMGDCFGYIDEDNNLHMG